MPHRKDRPNDNGYGGILVWPSIKLVAKRRLELEVPDLEGLWLEVRSHNNKFLLCTVYRPPNDKVSFWNRLQESINLAKESDIRKIIITGDINADPKTDQGKKLKDFVDLNNFVMHINSPTRITPFSSSILDQFLTNIPNFVKKTTIESPVSTNDHCTIGLHLLFRIARGKPFSRLMWDFKNSNFDDYRRTLATVNFDTCFETDDVNKVCQSLEDVILDSAKRTLVNKMVVVRPDDKPWFNGRLRTLLRIKNRAHNRAKATNAAEHWTRFRHDRNTYINELKKAKKTFEGNKHTALVEEGNRNNKKWWTILKSLLGQAHESAFPPLDYEGNIIVNDKEKADAFNEFFSNASRIDDSNAQLPDLQPVTDASLQSIEVTVQDVLDQLKALDVSKAYGPDGIPPRLFKEGKDMLASPLCRLYNISLQKHKFPAMLKMANVLPIHKKDDKNLCGNYRPVSLLNVNSKIFEKIIFKYVFNYIRENHLLSDWQSGFLPGTSTVTQLIEIYDSFCKAVSEGKEVRIVFLDISKAFDRVWHKALLHKLKQFGITGSLLKWFEDYLKDRFQRVVINGQVSEWIKLLFGVPQGSVLGPLLFLIFIDDIIHSVDICSIRLFADDTCLFITVDNREDAANSINEDLVHISDWANTWLVNFSPTKTKEMIISNKTNLDQHPSALFNDHVIDKVISHKHLGLTLSSDLKWTRHIDSIVRASATKLDMMRGLKYKLDRKSLQTIYMSFVRPSLEYGDCLFDGTFDGDLDKLEGVQVEAMRIVTGATARSSTEALYMDTKWPTLEERRKEHSLTMMHKIVNGTAPAYLCSLLPPRIGANVNRNLRNSNDYRVPFTRIETYRRSFFPRTLTYWNNLDVSIKNKPTVASFKASFAREKDVMNELLYYGSRWPSVHHSRIRMGCSGLNFHLFNNLHVIPSPECSCGYEVEDPVHFFFFCPQYDTQRRVMMQALLQIQNIDINIHTLLWGDENLTIDDNKRIFSSVQTYITETSRFKF